MGVDRKIELEAGEKDYDEQQRCLSRSATESLKSLARRHQLTLNTVVQDNLAGVRVVKAFAADMDDFSLEFLNISERNFT